MKKFSLIQENQISKAKILREILQDPHHFTTGKLKENHIIEFLVIFIEMHF